MFKYIVILIGIVGAGYFDIQLVFEPIGSFLIFLCLSVLWFYRSIIARYFPRLVIDGRFILFGMFAVLINIGIGIMLNGMVDDAARNLVSSIYDYKKMHGEFPPSLASIAGSGDGPGMSRGRLKFGSRFYYLKEGDSFGFGYRRFILQGRHWDASTLKFQYTHD